MLQGTRYHLFIYTPKYSPTTYRHCKSNLAQMPPDTGTKVKHFGQKILEVLRVMTVPRDYILQILRVLAVFLGLRIANTVHTRSISGFDTADTPCCTYLKYFGVRYSGILPALSCTAHTLRTRISAVRTAHASNAGSISGFHTARCSSTGSQEGACDLLNYVGLENTLILT